MIEAAQSDTRFILTCNYSAKVEPAILSRCPIIPLKFDKKDLLLHVKGILDKEQVKYDKASLKQFIEDAFHFYPDCRKIINYLQFCSNSGTLVVKLNDVKSEDNDLIQDIVQKAVSGENMLSVRQYYMQHKDKLNDYLLAGSSLFNYVVDKNIVSDPDGILKLTDLLYYLNVCVDKESVFFGMVTAVKKYSNN